MSAATSPRAHLPLPLLVLTCARDFEGLTEQGDNSGPGVNWLQSRAGIPDGAPWCAAFVNAAAELACALQDRPSPLEHVPQQGLVQSYVEHGTGRGWIVEDDDAAAGDLFALLFPGGEYHHIGLVERPPRESHFTTLEGNTNEEGKREGRKVMSRTRRVTGGVLFLRPWA